MIRNFIFSTTRQWNPGDEIILKGIIRILKSLDIQFNPLIFNRNPDIRSFYGMQQYRKKADSEDALWRYTKSGMMDNSVKPWMEYKNIDAIFFAGTPEWDGWRNRELYINAIKYHIPVYVIGIDSSYDVEDIVVSAVLKKAKFISIRNKKIEKSFVEKKIFPEYLPCPSLFSCDIEKVIDEVQCIGLIYRGSEESITYGNGWDKEKYQYQNDFFQQVILKYKDKYKIVIICHYIDELSHAQRDFLNHEVWYSYESTDYIDFYKKCDFVIGSRIHGIGIAASLGIPSIPIKYDEREGTLDGFYPDDTLFKDLNGINAVDKCLIHIKEMNQKLIENKKSVFIKYQKLLKNKMDLGRTEYDYNLIQIENKFFAENCKKYCHFDKSIYNQMIRYYVEMVLNEINRIIRGKRVIIEGGGLHTKKLLKYLTNESNIICIADNKLCSFEGYRIIRNNEILRERFDYIIISSYYYEYEMFKELEKFISSDKILSFYRIFKDNLMFIEDDFFRYLKTN